MENDKQTAVEWLYEQLPIRMQNYLQEEIIKAKAMEKEQIIEAAMWMPKPFDELEFLPELGEQYYSEIYGKGYTK